MVDLTRLFRPRSIAVIGATDTPGRVGRIIFENLQSSGCILYPINPGKKEIFGVPVLSTPEELPEGVDIAIISIGAAAALEAAEGCARKGVAFIIIVSGGFGETDGEGKDLEERLRALPDQYGCRILGPNSLGVFMPKEKLDTIFVEHGDRSLSSGGNIAFISQSGSVGVETLGLASNTGYNMHAFVGLGNKSDLDELDFLQWFGKDKETECLAFYLESLDRGRPFLEEARILAKEKPIVVLKAGRTNAGATAVSSHTGRLAGSDQVISGAFRQFGIQRAIDDEELCDASKCLAQLPGVNNNRIGMLTMAGGFGVMCADYIDETRRGVPLRMAELTQTTQDQIIRDTFDFASAHNPVDLTASADNAMYGKAIDALMEDEGVDIIICATFFSPPGISEDLIEEVASRARTGKKPIIVFCTYGPYTDLYLRRFYEAGVVGFSSISRTVRAARFLVERGLILEALEQDPEGGCL